MKFEFFLFRESVDKLVIIGEKKTFFTAITFLLQEIRCDLVSNVMTFNCDVIAFNCDVISFSRDVITFNRDAITLNCNVMNSNKIQDNPLT